MARRHSGSKQPGYRNRYDLEVPQPVSGRRRRFFGKVGQAQNPGTSFLDAIASKTTKPHSDLVQDEWGDELPSAELERRYLEEQRPPHWG